MIIRISINQKTKRESGRKTQLTNIKVAKAVADVIKTTLGPRSMLKMLLDPMGGIVLSNDGHAILEKSKSIIQPLNLCSKFLEHKTKRSEMEPPV